MTLPPLRERVEDIPVLAEYLARKYAESIGRKIPGISHEVIRLFQSYSWPGNVRELENLVQRLAVMAPGQVITAQHLPQQILQLSTAKQQSLLIPEEGIDFEDELVRIERAFLEAALRRSEGSKAAAARLLHIPAQKMKYLCRKHDL